MKRFILLMTLFSFVTACHRAPTHIEPTICAPPHPKQVQREKRFFLSLPENFSISPFPPLTAQETSQDWGKEYLIALSFADDFDLYRAITGFKRALYFLPQDNLSRRLEIEYAIALAYYLGKKYVEVAYAVESTGLVCVDHHFPAYSDLLLILYESYEQLGKCDHACHILKLIDEQDSSQAKRLTLYEAIKQADLDELSDRGFDHVVAGYRKEAKSVRRAEMLNALLPGAGYWYLGLKSTAITALLVNSLFIAAGAYFIEHGNTPAAVITLSLEGGWYFGGIHGAGLAAKYYNERMYCTYVDKIAQKETFYPLMMLKYTF